MARFTQGGDPHEHIENNDFFTREPSMLCFDLW